MKTSLILSLLLSTSVLLASTSSSSAANNFNNIQRTYVPNSLIPRRYDLDPVGQTNWQGLGQGLGQAPLQGSAQTAGQGFITGSTADQPAGIASLSTPTTTLASRNSAINPKPINSSGAHIKLDQLILKQRWKEAEALANKLLLANTQDQKTKAKLVLVLNAEAKQAYRKADFKTAAQKSRVALFWNSTDQTAKTLLAQCYGKFKLDFQSDNEHLRQADALASQNKLTEAIAEYQLALKFKVCAAPHIGLANVAVSQGRGQEASKEYQLALQLDPGSAIAHRQAGLLELATHDLVAANHDLSQALSLNFQDRIAAKALIQLWQSQVATKPNDVNAHLGLARAYLLSDNLDAAKEEYRVVAKVEPNNPHLPQARVAFKASLARRDAQNYLQAAKTLSDQGAYADANLKLTEAVKLCPTSAEINLVHGQVLEKLALYDQAHDAYMSVLQCDPKNTAAAKALKSLATSHGERSSKIDLSPPATPHKSDPLSQGSGPTTDPSRSQASTQANPPKSTNAQATAIVPSDIDEAAPDVTAPVQTAFNVNTTAQAYQAYRGRSGVGTAKGSSGSSDVSKLSSLLSLVHGGGAGTSGFTPTSINNAQTREMPPNMPLAATGAAVQNPVANTTLPMSAQFNPDAPALNRQTNPLWNGLASTRVGQKFLRTQGVSSTGAFCNPGTAAQPSPSMMPGPTTATGRTAPSSSIAELTAKAPLVQISDWQTAPYDKNNAASLQSATTSSEQPQPASGSLTESSAAALGLKPEIGLLALSDTAEKSSNRSVLLVVSQCKTSAKGISVRVTLKNNGISTLAIPPNQLVAIHCSDRSDQRFKIVFADRSLAPGKSTSGNFLIPMAKLEPSLDIYLPNFIQDGSKLTDLHAKNVGA
jgi:tetratricopeptide (TPR) repeat protein